MNTHIIIIAVAVGTFSTYGVAGGPEMNMKLDGLGGNPTTSLMWSAKLGKFKNGVQVGQRQPYHIYDCEVNFGKQFKVKESGSKWRTYSIDVSDITGDYQSKLKSDYFPHMRAGNSDGHTQILSRNSGKTRYLEEGLLERIGDAYSACEEESSAKGWSTDNGMCAPVSGIKVTGRCKYVEYPDGSYNASQKVSVSYTIPLDQND